MLIEVRGQHRRQRQPLGQPRPETETARRASLSGTRPAVHYRRECGQALHRSDWWPNADAAALWADWRISAAAAAGAAAVRWTAVSTRRGISWPTTTTATTVWCWTAERSERGDGSCGEEVSTKNTEEARRMLRCHVRTRDMMVLANMGVIRKKGSFWHLAIIPLGSRSIFFSVDTDNEAFS